MPKEDYLKKQFDRLARVLAKILADLLGLKYDVDLNQELKIISELNEAELGFNFMEILDLPNDQFIENLSTEKNFGNENFEILADIFLFLIEQSSNNEQNLEKKKRMAEKCRIIWEYLEKSESAYSLERNSKLVRIQAYLN
jgi:hypothetical protein